MRSKRDTSRTAPKYNFHRYIGYDRKQLAVNKVSGYESYAGTCFHSQQRAEKALQYLEYTGCIYE